MAGAVVTEQRDLRPRAHAGLIDAISDPAHPERVARAVDLHTDRSLVAVAGLSDVPFRRPHLPAGSWFGRCEPATARSAGIDWRPVWANRLRAVTATHACPVATGVLWWPGPWVEPRS